VACPLRGKVWKMWPAPPRGKIWLWEEIWPVPAW